MTAIDSVALPDIGTVATAFVVIENLIEEAGDAAPLFTYLQARLLYARDSFPDVALDDLPKDAQIPFTEVLCSFVMLLHPYSKQILAGRVVQHLKLKGQLKPLHELLDGVFLELKKDETDPGAEWRRHLPSATKQMTSALAKKVDDRDALAAALRDPELYRDSYVQLRRASESRDPRQYNDVAKELFALVNSITPSAELPTSATEEAIPAWFVPGSDVTYYPRHFAEGSFGAVHHGTWGYGTKVVVKVLLKGGRLDAEMFSAFLDEADLWYKFTHPYATRMFGACHVSMPPFIICEDATNGNMVEYLVREKNRATKKWRRLYEAALGVEYLHSKDVVHGDLKLNNILVGSDGYARVADFGLSKMKKREAGMFATTTTKSGKPIHGALRWRAPECFGGVDEPAAASDVYAFGMCIVEVFAEEPPYGSLDDKLVEEKITKGERPTRPLGMEDDIWTLVEGMTHRAIEQRTQLAEVLAALEKLAKAEEEEEFKNIVLCAKCENRIDKTKGLFCSRCGVVVVETKSLEDETLRIAAAKEIPRIVRLLTMGSDKQKINAANALTDYVFGDPTHQEKVLEKGAVPILLKLIQDKQNEDVRYAAVLAVGNICAVNEPIQNSAAFEHAVTLLNKCLEPTRPEKQRAKAAMALGLLADGNQKLRVEIDTIGAIDAISLLRDQSTVLTKAANIALEYLRPTEVTDEETKSADLPPPTTTKWTGDDHAIHP